MVTQLRSTLRIFISHSVHENEFGMRLASDLRRILGSDSVIWYDTTAMQSGDSWAKAIAEQIQRSNVFIILLSHSSLRSRWVQNELELAFHRSKKMLIIPILCDDQLIPNDLKNFQPIPCKSSDEYNRALDELLKALGSLPNVDTARQVNDYNNSPEDFFTLKRPQILLAYSSEDKDIAQRIAQQLNLWFDPHELDPKDSITDVAEQTILANAYLVILLSPKSVNSVTFQSELDDLLSRDWISRAVTVLPVLTENCLIPSYLSSYQHFNLKADFEGDITRLAEQLHFVHEINFSKLDGITFEALIIDLLTERGFHTIEIPQQEDKGVDLRASYTLTDPFGKEITENWLIELKLYPKGKVNLSTIEQLIHYLNTYPTGRKGLLITNGQLTSVAQDWLTKANARGKPEIRLIEGTELKRLLLQHTNLISKYFKKKDTNH